MSSNWFRLVASALAIAATASASAGQTIATGSWELLAPDGWVVNLHTKPVRATGPNGELLQFSSYGLPASSQGAEALTIRSKVEANAISAMQQAATETPLKVTTPLTSADLPSGVKLHQIVSTSEDGKALLAQWALLGPHAAVLITLDAQGSSDVLPTIRDVIAKMKWAP